MHVVREGTATEHADHKGRKLDEEDTGKIYLMYARISWGRGDRVGRKRDEEQWK